MYKVEISVLEECKKLLKILSDSYPSAQIPNCKNKRRADKLIKLLEDNYYV